MPQQVSVRSILNKKKQRDSWFLDEYTLNPYSGCSFNCLFCYIRGSKYGTHMEEKLSVKANAAELLDKQLSLRAKKKQFGFIVLSSATDPYLHFEKDLLLTRQLLEIILKYRFPVHVITRSSLVLRDLDLLKEIEAKAVVPDDLRSRIKGALITFSFSTLSDPFANVFEPGATAPSARLETMRTVSEKGFATGVSLMPLLPFISDTSEHLDLMFRSFKAAGARYIMPSTITLFGSGRSDSKTLVLEAVRKHFPELHQRYVNYFASSSELPSFYRSAFGRKLKELSLKFDMPDRIVTFQ